MSGQDAEARQGQLSHVPRADGSVRRWLYAPSSETHYARHTDLVLANVDWALLNFMKDWFPKEARQKLEQSEKEAAEEHMQELGFNTDGCIIS